MKNYLILLVIIVVILIAGGFYLMSRQPSDLSQPASPVATSTEPLSASSTPAVNEKETVVGESAGNRDIVAYHYGTGETELLFVGGIHGGYEWNTVLEAYQLMDYLEANTNVIPKNVRVTVIPVLNPDGLSKVVGTATGRFSSSDVSKSEATVIAGRLNADNVDLNRNFDCNWQPSAVWQKTKVSGGSKAFSEPESQAFKNYVENHKPVAVIVWFSAAGGVFASACDNGILPETETLAKTYAEASGYQTYDSFDFYETTGDIANWLAKKNIPAISVILSTHEDTEWNKNLAGVEALLKYYTK